MSYVGASGTCRDCGKLQFLTRKAARKYMHKRFPGEKMSVYECGGYFHFGHTPYGVRRGFHDRRNY